MVMVMMGFGKKSCQRRGSVDFLCNWYFALMTVEAIVHQPLGGDKTSIHKTILKSSHDDHYLV